MQTSRSLISYTFIPSITILSIQGSILTTFSSPCVDVHRSRNLKWSTWNYLGKEKNLQYFGGYDKKQKDKPSE